MLTWNFLDFNLDKSEKFEICLRGHPANNPVLNSLSFAESTNYITVEFCKQRECRIE